MVEKDCRKDNMQHVEDGKVIDTPVDIMQREIEMKEAADYDPRIHAAIREAEAMGFDMEAGDYINRL